MRQVLQAEIEDAVSYLKEVAADGLDHDLVRAYERGESLRLPELKALHEHLSDLLEDCHGGTVDGSRAA